MTEIASGIIFETLAVLQRNNPSEVRDHLRGLAVYVSERSGVEDMAALAGGLSAPNELNPPREVLIQRATNAADWLSRSEDPMNLAKAGHLVLTLAEQALRLWFDEQCKGINGDSSSDSPNSDQ